MEDKIYMIDTLSPFFLKCRKSVINWSKIPFDSLDGGKKKVAKRFKKILTRTELYFSEISKLGYNSISIDDLAHLTIYDFYKETARKKIAVYRKFYRSIIKTASNYGLKVYINTDIMFFNEQIEKYVKNRKSRIAELMIKAVDDLFTDFKDVNGVIFRIGEADFFRHIELNELFKSTSVRKIIELQTRREYEGHGTYPSYIGFYYSSFFKEIGDSIEGIHVWCQTGGWSSFINRTFSKKSSVWNEVNTVAAVKIFKEGLNDGEVIKYISRQYLKIYDYKKVEKFLMLSEQAINDLLYDPGFAVNKLYFFRLRLPPLLYIFWDTVMVNYFIVALFRTFNKEPGQSIIKGRNALLTLKEMENIACEIGLNYDSKFHYKTFRIILYVKKMIYFHDNKAVISELKKLIKKYRDSYPFGYNFNIDYDIRYSSGRRFNPVHLFIRTSKKFRVIDYLVFNYPMRFILRKVLKIAGKKLTGIGGTRGMNPDFFLK